MQVEIIEQFVDRQLVDAGIGRDFEEQAVRQMLFHLCIAIDIYRHMTQAEKNKAGYWYREKLKNSFSITGFLKERKRKRDKKKSPLHPSYKEESGVKEKSQKTRHSDAHAKQDLEERKKAFWNELLEYEGKYGRKMLLKFFYYWAEEMEDLDLMKWEVEKANKSFNIKYRLGIWSKRSYETDDQAADIHLERVKGKKSAKAAVNTQEEQAIAAKRAEDNEKLEQEIAERKAGAVPYEEYIRQKNEKKS